MKPRFSEYLQTGNGSPGLINCGNKDNRSKAILLTCLKKNSETFRQKGRSTKDVFNLVHVNRIESLTIGMSR